MKQPVVLRVYKGDNLEMIRQFEHSQIVIGRNDDVQLKLEEDDVALLHAMIEHRDGEYYISDLGSQTGTFRNGNRVLEHKLASGDQLQIGSFKVHFFVGVPRPTAPPKMTTDTQAPVAPPNAVKFSTPASGPIPTPPPEAQALTPKSRSASTAIASSAPAAPSPGAKDGAWPSTGPSSPAIGLPDTTPAESPAVNKGGGGSAGDKGRKAVAPRTPVKQKAKTFAPPNPYKDLKEVIKPHKGTVVEVLVAWNGKVLSSNHFTQSGSIFISSNPDADVIVPIISSGSKYELLKIAGQATVCLTQEMSGELIREGETVTFSELARQNKIRNVGTHFELDLRQGEMVRIGLQNDLISIYVRYVPDTPKPTMAPLLDLTSSELTGIILALAVSAILGLYMNIYTPSQLLDDEARQEEPIRKAVVQFKPPPKREEPKVEEVPKQEKKVVKVAEKQAEKKVEPKKSQAQSVKSPDEQGKAGELAPNPNAKSVKNKLASAKPGGAIKTAPKEGANMKAQKPDPTKVGLLGVFASKGTQKQVDKAYSGSGELQGMADAATGYAGNAENRAGDSLGNRLKDAGSGKGSSTVGIAGVGTQGRGTGTTGYGTGGIGQKGSVQINVQGQEGEFSTGMDREAIRRVIRDHIREIRSCYERELQRSPDLYGKIVLEWDIEEAGRVGRAVVKNNALGNDSVASCILQRLKTWKFPDPPKDQIGRVDYPFVFSSQ